MWIEKLVFVKNVENQYLKGFLIQLQASYVQIMYGSSLYYAFDTWRSSIRDEIEDKFVKNLSVTHISCAKWRNSQGDIRGILKIFFQYSFVIS